jgi:hypothetical protein
MALRRRLRSSGAAFFFCLFFIYFILSQKTGKSIFRESSLAAKSGGFPPMRREHLTNDGIAFIITEDAPVAQQDRAFAS